MARANQLIESGAAERAASDSKLAIVLALDGLREDLLERYDSLFTGGFRRLRDRGFWFTNAMVDHAVTVSHAGHVTIATGRHPANHGIVDAGYYVASSRGARTLQDAIADSMTRTVRAAGATGVPSWDPSVGEYVTSSYYMDTLPAWIRDFNARSLDGLADTAASWEPVIDLGRFDLGRPDSNAWEDYGRHPAFPHRLADQVQRTMDRRTIMIVTFR